MVGGFVNQNKRALSMVVFVCGSGKRLLGFEADAADVVELKRFGGFDPAEGVDVPNVGNFADFYGRGLGRVFQQILRRRLSGISSNQQSAAWNCCSGTMALSAETMLLPREISMSVSKTTVNTSPASADSVLPLAL